MTAPLTTSDLTAALATARERVWLHAGLGFDGERVERDVHLVYDASRILHYGTRPPSSDVRPATAHAPHARLPEVAVMPGLVEAHAHLFLEGGEEDPAVRAVALKSSPEDLLARAEPRLERLLRLGVVAVRDAGDKDGVGLALQRRWRSAERGTMPWFESPGAAIHHAKRYGRFMGGTIEEHGSVRAAVESRLAAGARRIKLLVTGIIDFERGAVTTPPQMSVDEVREAVAVAREAGVQTFAHCSGHDGVEVCLAGGVDTIEHGFFVTDKQLVRLRDADVAWVPTFAPVQYQLDAAERLGWSQTVRDHLRRILDGHAASLRRAHEIGVRIVAGSDAGSHGVPHGHGFLRELELMQAAGLPARAVLHAATGAPAARLGLDEPFGRLGQGSCARFLLVSPAALEDVSALRRPPVVVFDGVVHNGGDDPERPGM
jgi:imidazolonepropionase-like amidohydrolase